MKKQRKVLLTVIMLCFFLTIVPARTVLASGSVSVSASSSSLNIGDTVTISATGKGPSGEQVSATLTFTYDSSILSFVSCSESVYGGGAGTVTVTGTDSASITLKATAAGSSSISVSGTDVASFADATPLDDLSAGGTSVTVNNAATITTPSTGGGTAGGTAGGDTANLSGDNSLKSLTISPGTLSPAFKYSTTRYTATVTEDVNSIAVDAQVSNSAATVESVTGNTNLQSGENVIKIVVKAENGTTATYTITVTKSGTAQEDPEEEEEPQDEITDTGISINGISYEVSETLPEDSLPEEFTKTTTTYGDKEVEAYSFPYENLFLLYLTPEETEEEETEAAGRFYFYNAVQNQFFPYINITVGEKYVLVLPNTFAPIALEGYQETPIIIGEDTVNGYQAPMEDAEATGEFFLVYGVDKNGEAGWYQYDSVDVSLQRFNEAGYIIAEEETVVDASAYEQAYEKLEKKYKDEKTSARIIIAVLIFLLIVAIIAIINIVVFTTKGKEKKKKTQKGDLDYIDFDDL